MIGRTKTTQYRAVATALAAAGLLALLCCGCAAADPASPATAESAAADKVEKEPTPDIDAAGLQDKAALYQNDDPTQVRTFYLTVRSGNESENTLHTWQEINSYSVYDYDAMGVDRYQVEAILQEGDANGPQAGALGYGLTTPNATVQVRGQTSSRYSQKNYKIKLKKDIDTLDGQRTIALNKHWGDPLRLRNKLCYDLMSEIPNMMGLRTNFVHLYVKDETDSGGGGFVDYGLYTWVEQLNTTALMAHGADRNGQLYKINYFEFFRCADTIKLKTDPTYDQAAFEKLLEIKGDDDHTKLIAMLDAVNDYAVPIEQVCERYFDTDNLLTWMAFHILTGNVDTQNRNVYIYSPLNGNKWYFWSWDNDGSFNTLTNSIISEQGLDRGWEKGISNYWGNVLFQRVLKSADYRAKLDAIIEELYAGALAPDHVQRLAEQYAAVTKPYAFAMPDEGHEPVTPADYDRILAGMGQEIINNYNDYKQNLREPMPFYIDLPVKQGDGYTCTWDAAFDFDDPDVTYTAVVSRSLDFSAGSAAVLASYTGTNLQMDPLPLAPGQYFIKVTAANTDGLSQNAFDYYVTNDSVKNFGVKCFYVLADGSVEEPQYEE